MEQPTQLKTRVYRAHLLSTMLWYTEKLTEVFGPLAQSEARREIMRRQFESMQAQKRAFEKTSSWQIPLKLVFHENGTYSVDMLNPDRVLFLD